jgi:hypothetical protein
VTVPIARDHAAGALPPDRPKACRDAIRDIIDDLLPKRGDRQCERVKKPPKNTFPTKKRDETKPSNKVSYNIKITRKVPLPAQTP